MCNPKERELDSKAVKDHGTEAMAQTKRGEQTHNRKRVCPQAQLSETESLQSEPRDSYRCLVKIIIF